jgi:hypothetical protein
MPAVSAKKRHRWWLNPMAERRISLRDEDIKPLFFRIRISSLTGLSRKIFV